MSKTRHIQKRLSQRGIREELVSIAMDFGIQKGDKVVLNKKAAEAVIVELDLYRKKLKRLADKKGLVVVEADGSLVTAYDLDSYRRPKGA